MRKFISALLVFLLLVSVTMPAASAQTIDSIKDVGKTIKGPFDFAKEAVKEVIRINTKVVTDHRMRFIHLKTIAGAAAGAGCGPVGAAAGGIISTLEGYGEMMMEEAR